MQVQFLPRALFKKLSMTSTVPHCHRVKNEVNFNKKKKEKRQLKIKENMSQND